MLHIAWDQGICESLFESFGLSSMQKTTKTLCGKRVSMANISNNTPTCPTCENEWIAQRIMDDVILAELKTVYTR